MPVTTTTTKPAKSAKATAPVYRQKKIPHKEHLMQTYPDGRFRFCRYYGCAYCEAWDTAMGAWAPHPDGAGRRKPKGAIVHAQQLEMFPLSNEEAARALVSKPRRRVKSQAQAQGLHAYIGRDGLMHGEDISMADFAASFAAR